MIPAETILNLKKGSSITISTVESEPVTFSLNIGDATLSGEGDQVWLESRNDEKRLYLRRMPDANMSIGPALFASLADLAETLETGVYYIA